METASRPSGVTASHRRNPPTDDFVFELQSSFARSYYVLLVIHNGPGTRHDGVKLRLFLTVLAQLRLETNSRADGCQVDDRTRLRRR